MLLAHFWKYGIKHLRRASNVNLCCMVPRYTSGWCGTLQGPQIPVSGPLPQVNQTLPLLLWLIPGLSALSSSSYIEESFFGWQDLFPHQELNLGHNRAQNPNHSLGHQETPRRAWSEGKCRKPHLLVSVSLLCWIPLVTVGSRGLSIPHGEVIHVCIVVHRKGYVDSKQ